MATKIREKNPGNSGETNWDVLYEDNCMNKAIYIYKYIYISIKVILISNLSERIFSAKKSQLVWQVMYYSWLQMKYLHTKKTNCMKCLCDPDNRKRLECIKYRNKLTTSLRITEEKYSQNERTQKKNKTWNIWEKQLAQYPSLPAPPPPKKKKNK